MPNAMNSHENNILKHMYMVTESMRNDASVLELHEQQCKRMDTQMGRGWLPMNAPLNLTWVEVEEGGIPSSYGLENDAFWDLMALRTATM